MKINPIHRERMIGGAMGSCDGTLPTRRNRRS